MLLYATMSEGAASIWPNQIRTALQMSDAKVSCSGPAMDLRETRTARDIVAQHPGWRGGGVAGGAFFPNAICPPTLCQQTNANTMAGSTALPLELRVCRTEMQCASLETVLCLCAVVEAWSLCMETACPGTATHRCTLLVGGECDWKKPNR